MAEAVTKAGSTDKAAVRDAFESITGFWGFAGQYNYSATDHVGIHGGMWLYQIENGEYKLIGRRGDQLTPADVTGSGRAFRPSRSLLRCPAAH